MDGLTGTARQEKTWQGRQIWRRPGSFSEQVEALLHKVAQVEVALSRADGTIKGAPHYWVLEERAHEPGKQLTRLVQGRQMQELAAMQPPTAKCPSCGSTSGARSAPTPTPGCGKTAGQVGWTEVLECVGLPTFL